MINQWSSKDIRTTKDIIDFIRLFNECEPHWCSFDTETNGLHIIKHKPFLISFGFISSKELKGYTYTHDFELYPELTSDVMFAMINCFNKAYRTVPHNAKFDLNMIANIGYYLPFKNISDSMIYIRLAHDAIPTSRGGVPLQLKAYATKYIDRDARHSEKKLKDEMKYLKSERNRKLKRALMPYSWTENGRTKYWTLKLIDQIMKDKVVGLDGFPKSVLKTIEKWDRETPDPNNYQNLNRENLTAYAHLDIVYALEAVVQNYPVAISRGQQATIELEEQLIEPLFRMERVGFAFNREYTLEAKDRVKAYILQQRKELERMAGFPLKIGQHEEIKRVIYRRWQVLLPSTGADVLSQTKFPEGAQEFIDVVQELRTLEKWYSTYICKWLEDEVDGRVYTTINQVGTVSGRVSSNFQQFPQKGLYTKDGVELFHPRKMIKVTGGDYTHIAYLDYSQIELRFQAIYTILVNGGDENLCRAYMPFNCWHYDGYKFDFNNPEHIKRWDSGEWYTEPECINLWTKTDLHDATTLAAFPEITKEDIQWKYYRKMGKTTNFACNYGATDKTLMEQMGYDWTTATRLYNAYKSTFPGVIEYRNYVKEITGAQGYVVNLFGRKYYGASWHNNANSLVQGSSADFLKKKIIEADKYIIKTKCKTRLQMNIHDEISFETNEREFPHIRKLQKIMEELPGTVVPIVADIEITTTTWAEKEDYTDA